MTQPDLPHNIAELLEQLNAPERLRRHLQIVYATAHALLSGLKQAWPAMELEEELILFGAGSHDIGKAEITSELFDSGKEHEAVGKRILAENGFGEAESRFALTHGNWEEGSLPLEDLLVSLADKIWKGKRVEALEERVGHAIANQLHIDYWEVYVTLDKILEEISLGADERLFWQGQS